MTASGDRYAQVWNESDQKPIGHDFGYGSPIYSAEFSRDGTEILTTEEDGYTDIWDATQTTPTSTTEFQEPESNVPHEAVFSPDSSVVVTAGTDGTAREWNASTGGQMLTFAGHPGEINARWPSTERN